MLSSTTRRERNRSQQGLFLSHITSLISCIRCLKRTGVASSFCDLRHPIYRHQPRGQLGGCSFSALSLHFTLSMNPVGHEPQPGRRIQSRISIFTRSFPGVRKKPTINKSLFSTCKLLFETPRQLCVLTRAANAVYPAAFEHRP